MSISQRVVPPPPIQQPVIGSNGFLSPVWANWFNLFYRRAGDSEVTPVGDLEVQQAYDFDTLPSSVNRDLEVLAQASELQTPPSIGQVRRDVETFNALLESQDGNRATKDPNQEIIQALSYEKAGQNGQDRTDILLSAETHNTRRFADEKYIAGTVNGIINGGCISSQRASKSLTTSYAYGAVDLLAVKAGGTVSAGTVEQVSASFSLADITGYACRVNGATLTGSGAIHFRHRIESLIATRFIDKPANFSCRVYHDQGSSIDAIITISEADSSNDFTTVTQIDQITISVPNNTNFSLEFPIPDMTDCKNGIEIEVELDCGAVTTKNFYLGQLQLSIGQQSRFFENRPLQLEETLIHRYLRPIVGFVGVANTSSNMQVPVSHPGMRSAPSYEATGAIDMTDGYTADHSQSSASISTTHENTADNGRISVDLFSGLTSGRFYIHRGTSDKILASAEL